MGLFLQNLLVWRVFRYLKLEWKANVGDASQGHHCVSIHATLDFLCSLFLASFLRDFMCGFTLFEVETMSFYSELLVLILKSGMESDAERGFSWPRGVEEPLQPRL